MHGLLLDLSQTSSAVTAPASPAVPVDSIKVEALIGIVRRNSVLLLKQLLLFRPTIADLQCC